MQQIVITLVGSDRPGLVDRVSRLILTHQGNWLASSLSKMAGQFAGIIQVRINDEHIQPLADALNDIKELQCIVQRSDDSEQPAHSMTLSITVTGNDKPGIVQEVASAVHKGGGNILKMISECESAPNWGGELFKATLQVGITQAGQRDGIRQHIENIANDLMVDISGN